jgi:hypothetical protein
MLERPHFVSVTAGALSASAMEPSQALEAGRRAASNGASTRSAIIGIRVITPARAPVSLRQSASLHPRV